MKFGRIYTLNVQGQNLPHTLSFPLTVSFDIERHTFSMANTAKFSITGLSLSSRKDILFDQILKPKFYELKFNAGYRSQTEFPPLIFKGNVSLAYTTRSGPELVTHIEALDGGFGIDNCEINPPQVVPSPWKFIPTMKKVMSLLPNVDVGQIILDPLHPIPDGTRPLPLSGLAWDILQTYTPKKGDLFIDNGVVHMLAQNSTISGTSGLPELSSSTGLLNIPIKHGYTVECQSLFEPNFRIGQFITLKSSLASEWVNGQYKIIGLHHYGTIGGVDSGDCFTDLTLLSSKSTT